VTTPQRKMRSLGSLVLLASCLALAAADQYSEFDEMAGPANAHLVARKRVVESQVVAGQNITVSIEIFNTGAEAALDIHVRGVRRLSKSLFPLVRRARTPPAIRIHPRPRS
jgi:hypothetical protein